MAVSLLPQHCPSSPCPRLTHKHQQTSAAQLQRSTLRFFIDYPHIFLQTSFSPPTLATLVFFSDSIYIAYGHPKRLSSPSYPKSKDKAKKYAERWSRPVCPSGNVVYPMATTVVLCMYVCTYYPSQPSCCVCVFVFQNIKKRSKYKKENSIRRRQQKVG